MSPQHPIDGRNPLRPEVVRELRRIAFANRPYTDNVMESPGRYAHQGERNHVWLVESS